MFTVRKSDKGLYFRRHQNSDNSIKNKQHNNKQAKELIRHLTEKIYKGFDRHMKKMLKFIDYREIQIKVTIK